MRTKGRCLLSGAGAAALVAAVGLLVAGPAGASGPILSAVPARYTPWLLASTPDQYVRDLVPCRKTIYAVGTLSAIGQGTTSYQRNNAFSFSASTGAVTRWRPRVNGRVNAIALSPDCSTAYLGGSFTTVDGRRAINIAGVNTTTGALIARFARNANKPVETLQYIHGQLLAGGQFTTINGTARSRFASLKPNTGAATKYAALSFSGAYPNTTPAVFNSQISHSGTRLLIEGVFTKIAGAPRQQVAVLDLGPSSATLDRWTSTEFNRACARSEPFYEHAAAWAPNDATIYTAATGYKPASGPGVKPGAPRAGLCDAVAAFPATHKAVNHIWVNYTGCDSLYAVAADGTGVYIGGHERWADNAYGCNAAGPGAVDRPGIGAIDPVSGHATTWNPTRARGRGADDLLLTAAGLWVASDNWTDGSAQQCGGQTGHGGICFFPYSS